VKMGPLCEIMTLGRLCSLNRFVRYAATTLRHQQWWHMKLASSVHKVARSIIVGFITPIQASSGSGYLQRKREDGPTRRTAHAGCVFISLSLLSGSCLLRLRSRLLTQRLLGHGQWYAPTYFPSYPPRFGCHRVG
jgi:hypothetical protein